MNGSLTINNSTSGQVTATAEKNIGSSIEKAVIIIFDRGYKNQFTNAKPILDKYGFKASFFIIYSFVNGHGYYKLSDGSELAHKGDNAMDWDHVRQLYNEGHDIESHGMQHRDLRLLSSEQLEHEIAESKECLQDYGLEPTFFQFQIIEVLIILQYLKWYQGTLILRCQVTPGLCSLTVMAG